MALKKKPVTGMKDILPQEMQIRDYVLNQIKETFRVFGFSSIESPCVEHIANLTSKPVSYTHLTLPTILLV